VFPALLAFWKTVRYHLGSICLGGFILALITFLRIVFEYVVRQVQRAQQGAEGFFKCKGLSLAINCIRLALRCLQKVGRAAQCMSLRVAGSCTRHYGRAPLPSLPPSLNITVVPASASRRSWRR
jgi:hypothetical protein